MTLWHWLRWPETSAVLVVHVTGHSNLGRVSLFGKHMPPGVGLVAMPPPSEADRVTSMTTWVRAQADEILSVVPKPQLAVVGYCMAGHTSMHMVAEMRCRQVAVSHLFCLETMPRAYYSHLPIMELLDLPGPAHVYGPLADDLRELQDTYLAGGYSADWWGERMASIMRERQANLDAALLAAAQATPKNLGRIRSFYLEWAQFVRLVMTAPEVDRPSFTVDVLSDDPDPHRNRLLAEASTVWRLPNNHRYLLSALAQDPAFWGVVGKLSCSEG